MKTDFPSLFEKAPAKIHVVARRAEPGIKTADCDKGVPTERAIAAWNVLGLGVGHQHMNRAAWRIRDALGDRPIFGRWNIRTPDGHTIAIHEPLGQVLQPVG